MNWEAIGAIGEIVGAIAVFVTLLYLGIQLRLNTRALKSSTFQEISASTAETMQVIASTPGMSELIVKSQVGIGALNAEEQIRFTAMTMSSFRRIEAVYIQERLGSIESRFTAGFKRSSLSALAHKGMYEWWSASQEAFTDEFVLWVNSQIAAGEIKGLHIGMGREWEET
jgi:hypothetical protein